MTQRYYFIYFQTDTEHLAVTEVSKHKFENIRGFEDLTRMGSIPQAVRAKMDDMTKHDAGSAYRLFVTR